MDDLSHRPRAREQGLVVEPLDDELLIFDTDSSQAHALNATLAQVWRACDGQRDVEALRAECGLNEETLQLALDLLQDAQLLDEPHRVSRRAMLAAAGVAAGVALPAIHSITAPTPAMAASVSTADLIISPGVYEGPNGVGGKDYSWNAGVRTCQPPSMTLTQTFTVRNIGGATSDTLSVHGFYVNDTCSGRALDPNEECTVDLSWKVPCNLELTQYSDDPALVIDHSGGAYIDVTVVVQTVGV